MDAFLRGTLSYLWWRQMCTRSIFGNALRRFFILLLISFRFWEEGENIKKKILIRIFIHHDSFFSSFVVYNFFGGRKKNVKMRLTFMVVFFTIYNAQSQRKRNFSCINQKKAPWKGRKKLREELWIGVLARYVYVNFHRLKCWFFWGFRENTRF